MTEPSVKSAIADLVQSDLEIQSSTYAIAQLNILCNIEDILFFFPY